MPIESGHEHKELLRIIIKKIKLVDHVVNHTSIDLIFFLAIGMAQLKKLFLKLINTLVVLEYLIKDIASLNLHLPLPLWGIVQDWKVLPQFREHID